jgi:hypothetical protein
VTPLNKIIPLLKKYISFFTCLSILFFSCKKDEHSKTDFCFVPTAPPAVPSYYLSDITSASGYTAKQCGLLPLYARNYWVYEDSIFNNGIFARVQYDTLRYLPALRTLVDNLTWWQGNIFVGLPQTVFVTDSVLYEMADRLFMFEIKDVKKDFSLIPADSLHYLASFDDNAAIARSVKIPGIITIAAGSFDNCYSFEKHAPAYRKDHVYFKPGLGVLKYRTEKAQMGSRILKLTNIKTLVSWHIE